MTAVTASVTRCAVISAADRAVRGVAPLDVEITIPGEQ
jgi:hypothetical protein